MENREQTDATARRLTKGPRVPAHGHGHGLAVGLLALVMLALAKAPAGAAAEPKRVLMIHSFGRDFAPFSSVANRLRSDLALRSPHPVEFIEASLQTISGADRREDQELALVDYLQSIFSERAPDLVIAIGAPAAQLYAKHRRALFPKVPVLVAGADQRRITHLSAADGYATASLELDLPGVLEDILAVKPNTKRVYCVTGVTELENYWEQAVFSAWRELRADLEYVSLSDQAFTAVLEQVETLPPDSAVFVAILDRDAAGVPHEGNVELKQLNRVTSAPVFGFARDQLGIGIVGGRLVNMETVGARAAAAALRLLDGIPPDQIHVDAVRPAQPMYDWRELKRWDIAEAELPEGSRVLYRERSIWQTHRGAVLVGIVVIGVESILIFLLLAARRRAREMSESLTLAADAANVGVWDVDLQRREIRATAKWRELFDFPPTGPIRLDEVLARIHPDDRPWISEAIREVATHDKGYAVQHRIRRADGEERWMVSRGRADRANGSGQLRTLGVSIDITDRLKMETEMLQQRDQLAHLSRVGSLGAISGSLAHELNQPLGTILSNAQAARRMLAKPSPDLVEISEILGDIVSEDQRAGQVIARWRQLLRRGEVATKPVEVPECFDEVMRLAGSELAAKGVKVMAAFEEGLPRAMADRVQLQQVLLNLLMNAADAMESTPAESKRIEVSADTDAETVILSVSDRGSGLPADPEVLFEPFFTTKPNGLGMGLAICRTFITGNGGRLWAEANPGGGAIFLLSLPISDSETATETMTS